MRAVVRNQSLIQIKTDLLVVNLFEGVRGMEGATDAADKALGGLIRKLLKAGEISGALGKVTLIHCQGKLAAERIAVVGLGKREDFGLDEVRVAAAAAIRTAKKIKARTLATLAHGAGRGGLAATAAAQATVEGSILGDYKFKGYATDKDKIQNLNSTIKELIIVEKDKQKVKEMVEGVRIGQVLAEAANRARDLVNGPANKITPTYLANYAKKMASSIGFQCRIFDPKQIGMGALWSVAQGSREPARVVVIKSKPAKTKAKPIALIGKGVTFDSGGISLKPSKKLWEMKMDMAGAAAVIEAMRAIKLLGIKKEVMAIIPLAENMPDGGASRPGDVVTSLSGKTIEIISTDAEGRMLLADAITYARKGKAGKIITVATLTGGCVIALGDVASGVMSNNDELVNSFMDVSENTGEKMWRLPLYKEYKDYIKSDVADIKNSSETGKASPSSGGVFLQNFVEDTPWVHVDIAGTAYLSKSRGYLGEGATGVPVRTLVEFVKA